MTDPGSLESIAFDDTIENLRVRVWDVAERVGTDQGICVDQVQIPRYARDDNGKESFGKMRAAFFHRMFSRSSPFTPMTSSARSLASPVHMVRSHPQSRRSAPSASTASSSIPRSTPEPERSGK